MAFNPTSFQQWLTKNRIWLWWVIYIPFVALILIIFNRQLNLSGNDLNNFLISPQYKIFNSTLIIVLARVILIAVGVVIIMICLFFPFFRISKEGVQWTKEFEEELAEASGEIAGEEIDRLVKEESFRWTLIYGWLKLEERERKEPQFLLRELLETLWDAFPNEKISLCLINGDQKWGISHPLLANLVVTENTSGLEDDTTFGLKLQFTKEAQLLMHIYSGPEGFSPIDEKFIIILGEIFLSSVMRVGCNWEELLTYFDRVPLTFGNDKV